MALRILLRYDADLGLARGVVRHLIGLVKRWGPELLAGGAVAILCWLLFARGLRGMLLVLWFVVPLLALVAVVCFVGPGRLFPKDPYAGPVLVRLSTTHGLAALDLVGIACSGAAAVLGAWLILRRVRLARGARAARAVRLTAR